MTDPKVIDIGIVAKHSGLPASTLRYYEQKGLIQSIGRNGLRRLFNVNVLERLALIALGQQAGFSLEEVSAMVGIEGHPQIDREQLLNKADDLDQRVKQLIAMRDGLRHAANCPALSHLACPKFRQLLGVANKKRLDRKQFHRNALTPEI